MSLHIELKDETEGEHVETSDFFFDRIGEPVPVKSTGDGGDDCKLYELDSLPALPLAVSERSQLIFVAHSSGFCVARIGDVMEAAREIKDKGSASSIMELSIVDVSIGKVRVLSLSPDSSTLAASVGRDVHFFFVDALLSKEQEPFSSCSVEELSFLKDMRWLEKIEKSFILLSNHRKLYQGNVGRPLKYVMDDVDAVDVKGNFIAVARGNALSILSSNLKEKLCISLSSDSWTKDSGEECHVKVDSVKWIRPDCIVLGCFHLNSDGVEENYFVEVIRSKSGRIGHTKDASQVVAQSFYDVFPGIIDDILPTGDGPYMFFGYLDQCKLGIAANRKNTDQHIILFSWLLEVVAVDIDRDKWLPRIELQENGDDNLIVGLCIDKVSVCGKIKIQLGVEEERDLSPYCVLLCLTLEGKLSMFHVAGLSESTLISDAQVSDEEEDMDAVVSQEHGQSSFSLGLSGATLQNGPDFHKNDHDKEVTYGIPVDAALKSPKIEASPLNTCFGAQTDWKLEVSGRSEAKLFTHMEASEAAGQQKFFGAKQFGDTHFQGKAMSVLQSGSVEQMRPKLSLHGEFNSLTEGTSQAVAEKVAGEVSASASFAENSLFGGANELIRNVVDAGGEVHNGMTSSGFQILPQTWASGKTRTSSDFGPRFILDSNNFEGDRSGGTAVSVTTANVPGTLVGKPVYLNEAMASYPPFSSSSFPQQIGQKDSVTIGHIESLPSIRSSQLSRQEAASGFSSTKEDKKSGLQLGMTRMEPNISKQFGNIKEMVKELDMLLDSIEGKGGSKDACIVAQKSPVEALEKGIDTLSDQCTLWKGIMENRLEEVQQLLDKTVQVLSRKTYTRGIVKQATDDRYWELWNRQKLNPELELKRRHILKLNQDLTNQFILLERHFNTIELEKFSDGTGGPRGRQAYQNRFGPSRSLHSLHTLHNTLSSQLAAAEQLSDCLSRQMEVLSIDSPQVKTKSVKKELFDMIGLPYDDSFSSPVGNKVSDSPSAKKLMLSSSFAATKEQSGRKQLSALKPFEPETARRRRDSLGQGWTTFEPPKTTVKRMLLPESQKVSSGKSSLSTDKQQFGSSERATAAQKNRTSPSALSYQLANDGMQERSEQKLFQSPFMGFSPINESPGSGLTPTYQRTDLSVSLTSGPSITDGQNTPSGGAYLAAAKPISRATEKPFAVSIKETKPWFPLPSDTSLTEKKPLALSSSTGKATVLTKSPFELVKEGPRTTESSPHVIMKGEDTSSSSSFGRANHQAFPSLPEKVPQLGLGMGKSSSGGVISPSAGFKVDSSKSLLTIGSPSPQQSSSSAVSSVKTVTSSEPSKMGSWNVSEAMTDVNQSPPAKFSSSSVTSSSSSLIFSTSSIFSSSLSASSFSPSLSFSTPKPLAASSLTPPVNSTPKSHQSEVESKLARLGPELDRTTYPEAVPLPKQALPSEPTPKLVVSQAPTSASKILSGLTPTPEFRLSKVEPDPVKISPESDGTSAPEAVPPLKQAVPSEPTPKLEVSQAPKLTSEISSGLTPTPESRQPEVGPGLVKLGPEPDVSSSEAMRLAKQVLPSEPTPKLGLSKAPTSTSELSSGLPSVNETSPDKTSTPASSIVALQKVESPEDEMEEEAPETDSNVPSLNLGSLNAFGLGSSTSATHKGNPFGADFGNVGTVSSTSSPFNFTVPSGELFRPASFSFPSQSSQPSQPQGSTPFSGGFGAAGFTSQAPPTQGGFGQPAQIGGGQQALGSVLGSFGQSRQIGPGLPGAGLASSGGFAGGFGGSGSTGGGFSNAATSGGFAGIGSAGGGFGALASSGGFGGPASAGGSLVGFAAAASAGGGFAGAASGGGGFSAAGGGSGAFGGQQAGGGFSGFGGNGGNTAKPPELFTQMRK